MLSRDLDPIDGDAPRSSPLATVVWVGAWLCVALGGYLGLSWYASSPGESAVAPERWPEDSGLTPPQGRPALLMVVHPRCSCTRASIAELARLMASLSGRVDAQAVFAIPHGATRAWRETDLWASAARIPGVRVVADEGAVEQERFGARTSGQILLYDADHRLRFAGGITPGRSHQGDSAGRAELMRIVGTGQGEGQSAVYGCALSSREAREP